MTNPPDTSKQFQSIDSRNRPTNIPPLTHSNASVQSEDDFDVNEYFARLQGTRYVSAPIHSLKENQNANLEATEENLEEINLNENRINADDIQQSLTADIAQNFSQLPQVLPQVASAVFSSFSSMLSLKSRDVTPEYDAAKSPVQDNAGYQEAQFHGSQTSSEQSGFGQGSMPMLSGPGLAPPPKEPPKLPSKYKQIYYYVIYIYTII